MASKNKTKGVQVGPGIHEALRQKADAESTTIRALLEEAVLTRWPELRAAADVVTDKKDEEAAADLFAVVLSTVFSSPDPTTSNELIEAMKGTVAGTYGQPIKLKDLAYHLRSSLNSGVTLGTMAELVADYEGGRAS